MSPKHVTFNQSTVLGAAVEIVRRKGLAGLTARNVAGHLESSVAPVYYSFRSMERLKRAVLDGTRRLMERKAAQPFTDIRFLNIGVGVVVFARDEARLYRALMQNQPLAGEIASNFSVEARARMREDSMLGRLPGSSLERLWDLFWLFIMGLAAVVSSGQMADPSDENIVRQIRNTTNTLIFAEVAGIADCESPENAREWSRLLLDKKIILPAQR